MNKSRSILFGILLPVFGTVFVCSFELLDSSFIPRFIFISFFLCLSLLYLGYSQIRAESYKIQWLHPLSLLLFLWVTAAAFSGINTINKSEYFAEVQKVFLYFTEFIVLSTFINKHSGFLEIHFLKAIVIVLFFCVAVGAYQFSIHNAAKNVDNLELVTGLMSYKNLFSEYLAICIPFILLAFLRLNNVWKGLIVFTLPGIIILILLLQARSSWVALFLSFIIFLTIFFGWRKKVLQNPNNINTRKIILIASGIISAIVLLIWLSDIFSNHTLSERFLSIFETDKGSAGARIDYWKISLDMAKQHPFSGIGADNWKILFESYGYNQSDKMFVTEPLNDYFGVLSECGLFGLIGFSGAIILGMWLLLKQIFSELKQFPAFQATVLAALITWSIISWFNFPKDRIEHSVFLIFLLAFSANVPLSKPFKNYKKLNLLLIVLLFCGSLFSGWYGYQRYVSEKYTRKAIEARNNQKWEAVIQNINKAESPYYELDPTTTPIVWYRGIAYYALGKTDKAFQDFLLAYKANPYHMHVINNLATCYELKGNHERAIELYKEALKIYPDFIDALLNLSSSFYNIGRYDEALFFLENTVEKSHPKIKERIRLLNKTKEEQKSVN